LLEIANESLEKAVVDATSVRTCSLPDISQQQQQSGQLIAVSCDGNQACPYPQAIHGAKMDVPDSYSCINSIDGLFAVLASSLALQVPQQHCDKHCGKKCQCGN
jgi:hypothetical protein